MTDKGCDVAGEVIEKLYLMELQNALSQLNEKERQIITLLYGEASTSEAQCASKLRLYATEHTLSEASSTWKAEEIFRKLKFLFVISEKMFPVG